MEQDIISLVGKEQDISQEVHKEEMKARIVSGGADRQSIREKLKLCIDPLNPTLYPPAIVNIVSAQVADGTVNVQDAVAIGTRQMQEFEKGWPEGFWSTISKKVKTIFDSKKHIKVGSQKLYDTSMIYSRVIGIQTSSRDIDIKKVLSHELAPVPTSMFHDSGAMRIRKPKSDLRKRHHDAERLMLWQVCWMALLPCGLSLAS